MANYRKKCHYSTYPKGTPKVISCLGDSITAGADEYWDVLNGYINQAAPLDANGRTRGDPCNDKGTGGDRLATANNAASVEARFTADVITFGAEWVIVEAAINDLTQDADPVSNMQTAIAAMKATADANNIRFDVMNCIPFGSHSVYGTETKKGYRNTWNTWLLSWANSNGVVHYDIASAVADSGDSDNLSATYGIDPVNNVHPNAAGAAQIADVVWRQSRDALVENA